MDELERTAPAETKVAELADVRVAQGELENGGDVAAVLRTYYDADVVLRLLEQYVGDAFFSAGCTDGRSRKRVMVVQLIDEHSSCR